MGSLAETVIGKIVPSAQKMFSMGQDISAFADGLSNLNRADPH